MVADQELDNSQAVAARHPASQLRSSFITHVRHSARRRFRLQSAHASAAPCGNWTDEQQVSHETDMFIDQ
jgi:hypothetical protein